MLNKLFVVVVMVVIDGRVVSKTQRLKSLQRGWSMEHPETSMMNVEPREHSKKIGGLYYMVITQTPAL